MQLVLPHLLEFELAHDFVSLVIALRLNHNRPVLFGVKSLVSLFLIIALLLLNHLSQMLFLNSAKLIRQVNQLNQVALVEL